MRCTFRERRSRGRATTRRSRQRQGASAPLRHVGLYAYRAGFLRRFPRLAHSPLEDIERLEQLRVLWHGERIAVHVSALAPGVGVDTAEDLAQARRIVAAAGGFCLSAPPRGAKSAPPIIPA